MVQFVPKLKICPGAKCGAECPYSHAPIGESIENVILEVWNRSFLQLSGQKSSPAQADLFTVFLRMHDHMLDAVVTTIAPGLYFEPRQEDPRLHNDKYKIIWMPKNTLKQLMHITKTNQYAIGIARLKERLGRAGDEDKAWSELRPGETLHKCNSFMSSLRYHTAPAEQPW